MINQPKLFVNIAVVVGLILFVPACSMSQNNVYSGGSHWANDAHNETHVGKCANFHPGMEFRVSDDLSRKSDGLAGLSALLALDIKHFKGVFYQTNWAMIEPSPGVYDWSRMDKALELVKRKGMHMRVRVQDRTFWTGCGSAFVPPGVENEASFRTPKTCFAKIWEQDTMNRYISMLTALVDRYKSDPAFIGIAVEETALDAPSFKSNPSQYRTGLYPQLERLANAIHAAAPNILFTQYLNWPSPDKSALDPVVNNLASFGSGAAISWPDSILANQHTWSWYQYARDYYTKLVIAPDIEAVSASKATELSESLEDHEALYQMLVGDLHANIIVWDTWSSEFGNNYFAQVVIPTVNKHNGEVLNNTCPFK